jgi:hypothetical protein
MEVGPSNEPGAGAAADGAVGDMARDRSGLPEHPAANASEHNSIVKWRDM